MPVLDSISFVYNGITSEEMGLYNVQIDSNGFFEETFLSEREIKEVQVRGRGEPYFQGVIRSPLTLSLSFAFKDTFDEQKIREVARWLDQDEYREFYTTDNPSKVYMCMLNSSSSLLHNGLQQGYVKVEFRCDAPWAYSPIYSSPVYDYTTNPAGGTNLTFRNDGDMICKPEIWITKIGVGDVSIFNTTNGNIEFKFTALANNETVLTDCENEYIETDISGMYRYNNFNNEYLELVFGDNVLNVVGNCKLQFRYRFKLLQG